MQLQTTHDIRDFNAGDIYFVITDQNSGRCVLNGLFIAAWPTKDSAKVAARELGPDFCVVKQVKQ